MMTDKQQIEEMASILCKGTSNEGLCEKCDFKKHEQFGFMYQCRKFDDAEALYNKNYRKVREGTIVVDKEYLKKELQGLELQARKETAKEIVEEVETLSQTMGWDISRIVKWLRKNHGVDVED